MMSKEPVPFKISSVSFKNHSMLPFCGEQLEFLAKNLKIPSRRVLDILSVISVNSDRLVHFIVDKRLTRRGGFSQEIPNLPKN
jgi:hypothetical protein